MIKNNKTLTIRLILILILIFVLIFLLYFKIKVIQDIMAIFLISFIFSYTLKPIYKYLIQHLNINKRVLAGLLVFFVVGFIVLTVIFLIPILFSKDLNVEGFFNIVEDLFNWINESLKLEKYQVFKDLFQEILSKFNKLVTKISTSLIKQIIEFSKHIISLAIVPILTYYLLADYSIISNKFYLLFPINKRSLVKKILDDIDKILGKFILSQFLLCGVIGVLTFVILILLDVKYALFLSIFNSIVNIVPYIGPLFGAIPALIVAIMDSKAKALYVLIAYFLIQQIEGNVLAPLITSNSIRMHPLVVIVVLMVGEKFGGFTGMILAVPVTIIIRVVYENINYRVF